MNEDMNQFLGVFLDEANEQLELLEQDILKLEHDASTELLQGIFRAAHTLKGSSRAMGFVALGELTHAMEDVFDKLRHDEISVESELINALFEAVDCLRAMIDEIAAGGSSDRDTSVQTARLRAHLADGAPAPVSTSAPAVLTSPADLPQAQGSLFNMVLTDPQHTALLDARANGLEVFAIRVNVDADCVMKSVRALMVLQGIDKIGSVLATVPDDEALENEEFELSFDVVVATDKGEAAVRETVFMVSEVVLGVVAPWPGDNQSAAEATAPPADAAAQAPVADSTAVAAPLAGTEARVVDVGPEGRGKPADEVQRMATEKKSAAQPQTVRVDVARLDKLLNLVGELVIDRTRIAQLGAQFEAQYEFNPLVENLNETSTHVGRITDELQEEIMKARMLPIDNVFNRFPRMVRDLAQKLNKEIDFVISGRETELDRSVIEIIGDPLIHMLRNSVDHGVETPEVREAAGKPAKGTIWLRARHEENHIVIEIEDDGRGIDPQKLRTKAVEQGIVSQEAASRMTDKEAVNLIFASGFSTAKQVSDVSGRGVGMDIVKSNLQKLGALIDIDSRVGMGSTFTVKLPLTLAIIRGLLVTVRGCVYALPLGSVQETIRIDDDTLHMINHREVILQRGTTLPVIRLREVFHLDVGTTSAERALEGNVGASAQKTDNALYLVVVGNHSKRIGLVVDSLIGEQEIVIKTLGKFIGDIQGISGATILGDGRVALIVDINGLINLASSEKGMANAA